MVRQGDILILLLAAIALVALYTGLWGSGRSGELARITAGDGEQIVAALDHDRIYRVAGRLGTSVIEVRDGHIRFNDSPCRGKQCVHSGWLEHEGDFAACLPNGISVAVLNHGSARFDSINF